MSFTNVWHWGSYPSQNIDFLWTDAGRITPKRDKAPTVVIQYSATITQVLTPTDMKQ